MTARVSLFLRGVLGSAVLAAMLALAVPARAAQLQPYGPGEKIRFNIHKMGIKFGTATLTFEGPRTFKGRETVLIVFTSRGPNFYDEEHIYLHPDTFRPLWVARDVNIFGKKEKIEEEYLEDAIVVTKHAGKKTTQERLPNKTNIDNIYGFIYRYRAAGSFKVGDQIDVHLPTKNITLRLMRQEKIDAARQKFDSYYMESDQYKVWFDVGGSKLPLQISGAVGLASTVMTMAEHSK